MLYSGIIRVYGLAIRLAGFWSLKARQWIQGRQAQNIPSYQESSIWFHVASLGEFEQARPLIEAIRHRDDSQTIVLSFFSPSGFEQRKDYDLVNDVIYLPLDTVTNARMLLDKLRPKLLVFTKYDLWFNLIRYAQIRGTTCILISTIFRPGQMYFSVFGKPLLGLLKGFKALFVQDMASKELAEKVGLRNVILSGDTRIDRVLHINSTRPDIPQSIKSFIGEDQIIILGSSWKEDEELIIPYLIEKMPLGWKVLVAPHEVDEANIRRLEYLFKGRSIRLSQWVKDQSSPGFLIIDTIGLLNRLYATCDIAYIGGGFGKGIHNTLEPAAAKLPIIFGPKYYNFKEARDMVALGTAFSIGNIEDFDNTISNLWSPERRETIAMKQEEYLKQNSGATSEILDLLILQGLVS